MRDLFLVYCQRDEPVAAGLAARLGGRGLELGRPVALWPPGMRLLKLVDAGLVECRRALVIVSKTFLEMSWGRKELDALAARHRVVCLLHGLGEADVAPHSARLAVAAIPDGLAGRLDRLLRAEGEPGEDGGSNGRPASR